MKEEFDKLFKETKEQYYKVGKIKCRSFNNEEVEFGSVGWRHILIKNNQRRSKEDMERRIMILSFAPEVVRKGIIKNYIHTFERGKLAKLWRLEHEIGGIVYKVVIRQISNSNKHFLSIMN